MKYCLGEINTICVWQNYQSALGTQESTLSAPLQQLGPCNWFSLVDCEWDCYVHKKKLPHEPLALIVCLSSTGSHMLRCQCPKKTEPLSARNTGYMGQNPFSKLYCAYCTSKKQTFVMLTYCDLGVSLLLQYNIACAD